jgi:hypothetical protein
MRYQLKRPNQDLMKLPDKAFRIGGRSLRADFGTVGRLRVGMTRCRHHVLFENDLAAGWVDLSVQLIKFW